MMYREFLKLIICCCIPMIQARELNDKRDPFQWTSVHKKIEQKQKKNELSEEIKEKKPQIQLLWKLIGISFNDHEPCALLTGQKGTLVVRKDQDIGQGWKIDKIHQSCVGFKHIDGQLRELKL